MTQSSSCDVAIIGGGLSGCLIAFALAEKRPELDVRIIEAGAQLGGNHIWSFFESDVAAEHRWLVEPLISYRWPGYDVAFPNRTRRLDAPYNSIRSAQLDRHVRNTLPAAAIVTAQVVAVGADDVTLEGGQRLSASQIIDARGPGDLATLELGFQKFVGMEIKVPGGHGLDRPLIMDATVEQIDGYRFVYCLPFDAETVFLEDTYYSETPTLDVPAIRERIIAYAAGRGWQTNGGGHEETGILPVVIGGDFEAYWASSGTHLGKAGLRAGLFHATTGYSLPDAVRLAATLAEDPKLDIRHFAKAHWRKQGYFRMLDTMLFRAAEPEQRYRIFERFYGLSGGLIGRFYSGQSTLLDKLRIVSGRPPVPIGRAIRALLGKR